jgi:hypothetical protein
MPMVFRAISEEEPRQEKELHLCFTYGILWQEATGTTIILR